MSRHYNRVGRVRPKLSSDARTRTHDRPQPYPCCKRPVSWCEVFAEIACCADLHHIDRCIKADLGSCLMNHSDTADAAEWIAKVRKQKGIWTWKWT